MIDLASEKGASCWPHYHFISMALYCFKIVRYNNAIKLAAKVCAVENRTLLNTALPVRRAAMLPSDTTLWETCWLNCYETYAMMLLSSLSQNNILTFHQMRMTSLIHLFSDTPAAAVESNGVKTEGEKHKMYISLNLYKVFWFVIRPRLCPVSTDLL